MHAYSPEIPVQLMKPLLLQLVRWYSRSSTQRMTPSDTEIAEVQHNPNPNPKR